MIRIGIIGTENSHAMAFSKIINLPDPVSGVPAYPDAKVVGVYGPDPDSARQVAEAAKVDFIAEDPADFFGRVDAMIITSRRGSVHAEYARPFIEAGMPVFLDKPITVDYAQAQALIALAKEKNSLLCGGSGCKLAYDVCTLRDYVQDSRARGNFISGVINFPAYPDSEYDGFFFYASHLTEMALTVFGYDPVSVIAAERNQTVTAILRYPDFDVTLQFTPHAAAYSCTVYTEARNYTREIDISRIYNHEVAEFMRMIRTGTPPQSYESLIRPVAVIQAILHALKTKTEVTIQA
ncbi:MAG: Gfo/Idh/MocA family protein [Hominenteromicrobium sp.]